MGRKGKELTTEQKELIVRLSEDNVSGPKISEILRINRFTIAKFLKRYRMRENLENASRSGRPKLTDATTDSQLLRVAEKLYVKLPLFMMHRHLENCQNQL